jgi:selenide,water dikinase
MKNDSQAAAMLEAKTKQLILLGGGHTHALVLRSFINNKPANTEITLISPNRFTPYSGMLPGLIAGHYRYDDMHIDLASLCQRANIRFIEHRAIALHADQQCITLDSHTDIHYDLLSIDIGITPDSETIVGAQRYGISVKPIAEFYSHLQALRKEIQNNIGDKSIAVIGGGAGSIEIIFALAHSLRRDYPQRKLLFSLITGAEDILLSHPIKIRNRIKTLLEQENITLLCNHRATQVTESYLTAEQHDASGNLVEQKIPCDKSLWCTSAKAASWLSSSGLQLHDGFIVVDQHLRSASHHNVFAAGDIAYFSPSPLPKAGVFAVRQASTLQKNLCNALSNNTLAAYKPQKDFLSLLAIGEKYAIGSRGNWLIVGGKWVWHWKDYIDRKFMSMF